MRSLIYLFFIFVSNFIDFFIFCWGERCALHDFGKKTKKQQQLNQFISCATPPFADGDAAPDEEKQKEAGPTTTIGGEADNISDESQILTKTDEIDAGKVVEEEKNHEELW